MRISIALWIAALALPAVASAQQRGVGFGLAGPAMRPFHRPLMPGLGLGPWWKNSEIAKDIGLTDAQAAQIEKTFIEHRLRLIDLRADLEKKEVQLQPLLDADQLDEAKISAQVDQVIAARGRLEKELAMMGLDIRHVLAPEQWKKLRALQQKRARMIFHRWLEGRRNVMYLRRGMDPAPEAGMAPDLPLEQLLPPPKERPHTP